MDIHPSHQPIQSYRDAAIHLALITAGVLIALSFEGVVQWREHRALAREGRANLLNEIRDNRTRLQGLRGNLSRASDQLNRSGEVAQTILDKKPVTGSLQLDFNLIDLRNTSSTTAEVTGAFAHMDYDQVIVSRALLEAYDKTLAEK